MSDFFEEMAAQVGKTLPVGEVLTCTSVSSVMGTHLWGGREVDIRGERSVIFRIKDIHGAAIRRAAEYAATTPS